jgi:hypothetical protein
MLNVSSTLEKHLSESKANGVADAGSSDDAALFAGVLIISACLAAIIVAAAQEVEPEPQGRDMLIITITESATEAATEAV